ACTPTSTLSLHDALPIFAALLATHRGQGEVNQLRTGEQVGSAVRAGCDTGTTADAGRVVQSLLCLGVVDQQIVGVRCGTSLDGRSEEHTSELQSRFDLVC